MIYPSSTLPYSVLLAQSVTPPMELTSPFLPVPETTHLLYLVLLPLLLGGSLRLITDHRTITTSHRPTSTHPSSLLDKTRPGPEEPSSILDTRTRFPSSLPFSGDCSKGRRRTEDPPEVGIPTRISVGIRRLQHGRLRPLSVGPW